MNKVPSYPGLSSRNRNPFLVIWLHLQAQILVI
uniref:Uncharacterized protein n=1 Tax=Setaria italica TaxID=4555 RepID=K3YFA3_SETIT